MILGIESTAHTFGVAVVKEGEILSNISDSFTTKSGQGGMIPTEVAEHHEKVKDKIYKQALEKANIKESEIKAIALSNAPGLAPSLLEGMKFAKQLAEKLSIPIIPVNHCIAHLEITKIVGAKDPVLLYVSGANTQIISYAAEKYRIFGETLDMGVGNMIDTFARYIGLGFPGGPKIAELAEKFITNNKNNPINKNQSDNRSSSINNQTDRVGGWDPSKKQIPDLIELPYSIKGMDVSVSGLLTKLKQLYDKLPDKSKLNKVNSSTSSKVFQINKIPNEKSWRKPDLEQQYTVENLAYSLQETVFAMMVEAAERALAHTGKNELALGGGVCCNTRLQEMCKIMCKERGAAFFCPEKSLLVDNAAMIAYTGEIMFHSSSFEKDINKIDIKPRERTDDVVVSWK
ncbi:MAG: UGMP family protein [Nanoarchaeota archaeon]|nr:UGMP family protein [Nanoarchaeota archaeon]